MVRETEAARKGENFAGNRLFGSRKETEKINCV